MPSIKVKGISFEVDAEDVEKLSAFIWTLQKANGKVYARTDKIIDGKRFCQAMHRIITDCPKGLEVDHVNGITTDNRRANLRVCTHLENMANNRQAPGISGYKGVWKASGGKSWAAVIKHKGKRYSLGTFKTPQEAAEAWNRAAIKLRGEFACLNKI